MMASCELHVGNLSGIPTGVLCGTFQWGQLTKAGFEDESFLLALPQEIFILLGQGTEVLIFAWVLIDDVLWVVLNCFAVGEQAGPHGGPAGMEDLSLGHIRTELLIIYSKTQSSYW